MHEEPDIIPEADADEQTGVQTGTNRPAQGWEISVAIETAIEDVRTKAQIVMEGRLKSIALTHLETAELFFIKAIQEDGTK